MLDSMFQPGDYCLLTKPKVTSSPWPALIYPEDMVPKHILQKRPSPDTQLVLLVKEKAEFIYASPNELLMFEPQDTSDSPALTHSYGLVYGAMDFGDSLEYWRTVMACQRDDSPGLKRARDSGSEDDSDSDLVRDIREAKKRSRVNVRMDTPTAPLKHSSSPPVTMCHDPRDIRRHFPPSSAVIASSSRNPSVRQPRRKEDIVEGDLSESKEFVELLIGPDQVQFLLPLDEIKRRDYFSSRHHGFLRAKGDQAWALDIPGLRTITPEDFQYAAEYLSTGDYGTRVIDDDNRDTAVAECITAWEVADKLGMEDLLELVVAKSRQAMPWKYEELAYFSGVVYQTEGALLDSHATMKELLAEFVSENYYDILEEFGGIFTEGMRRLPEWERDVFMKLAARAEKRLKAGEDFV